MIRLEFTDKDIEELHYQRFHHPHPRVQQRMEALYLKGVGYPHQEIGHIVGVSQKTLRSYLRLYQAGGIAGLKKLNFHQPSSDLEQHQETIEAEFKAKPPQSINEAAERIEQLTGIRRCPTQTRQFLKRLGTKQGCSVLKDAVIIEDIIKIHRILKEFKADIFNIVFA